ncbi:MAG: hypothetical protein QOE05_936 [Actinomycetota bacterium]|jgi:hypothetical protein|nr:hypothetical protein [Actinomycetota bacterium]
MTQQLSIADRLRIERVVWGLDQRIYDLPWRRRIAIRREVRENLRTAAADVGAERAVRNIGSAGELAAGYLDAQFGSRPRPSWLGAAGFVFTTMLILQAVLTDAANAFADGVRTANPAFAGTLHWGGLHLLQTDVTVVITGSTTTLKGGALSVWGYLLLALGAIAVGRLWRALPGRTSTAVRR